MTRDGHNPLSDYLADLDEPCPLCGYNLRGLQGEHCPECGQELALRVNLVDPVRGAYLAGLISLACGFGFNALLLVLFVSLTVMLSGGPPGYYFVYQFIASIVTGGLLLTWVRSSVRIRRLPRRSRIMLALAAVLVPIASVVLNAVMIVMDVY